MQFPTECALWLTDPPPPPAPQAKRGLDTDWGSQNSANLQLVRHYCKRIENAACVCVWAYRTGVCVCERTVRVCVCERTVRVCVCVSVQYGCVCVWAYSTGVCVCERTVRVCVRACTCSGVCAHVLKPVKKREDREEMREGEKRGREGHSPGTSRWPRHTRQRGRYRSRARSGPNPACSCGNRWRISVREGRKTVTDSTPRRPGAGHKRQANDDAPMNEPLAFNCLPHSTELC